MASQFNNNLDGNGAKADTLVDSSEDSVANAEVLKSEDSSFNESAVQEQIETLDDAAEALTVDISIDALSKKDTRDVNAIESKDAVVLPEIVNVYATATFSQCPYLQLSQEDLDSLYMFITSKDHLKNNIASIHYDKIYSL